MKAVELRIRSPRAPGGQFRLQVGVGASKGSLATLRARRDKLRRLADRGEWDVLEAIRAGQATAAEVERLIDERGVQDYRSGLDLNRATVALPSLDAHMKTWLGTITKDSTRTAYKKSIKRLTDFEVDGKRLGDRPWPKIAPHTIQDVKASIGLSTNTVRLFMGAWSSFFSWAIKRDSSEANEAGRARAMTENPVHAAATWDKIETTRHRFLSWDEFTHLLDKSPLPMRAQYATLVLAGLRIEEFMTLPPAHVFLPRKLHIGPWGGWAPKGWPRYDHGVRDVPIHRGTLLPLLEDYAKTYAGSETFFCNPNTGGPWRYASFTLQFKKDVEAAGLIYGQWTRTDDGLERKREGITPHTCRHTLASWLAGLDVQLGKVALILGDTVETVQKHYSHLLPTDLDQSIGRIGGFGK